jgi:hypothetical protein
VLEHLDTCPTCYRQWLALSSAVESEFRKPSPADYLSLFRVVKQKKPAAAAIALATAACLVLFLWLSDLKGPEVAGLINESFQTALLQKETLQKDSLKDALALPWEKGDAGYSFGGQESISPPSRAFGAGLWAGRQALVQKEEFPSLPGAFRPTSQGKDAIRGNEWSKTPYAPYFYMGRWGLLVRSVCLSGAQLPPAFWEQQRRISRRMQEDFRNRPQGEVEAGMVNAALARLKPILEERGRDFPGKRKCRKISSEMGRLIDKLSPHAIPRVTKG